MKIMRMKRGWRIRLSDSEMAALQDLAIRGEGELEGFEEWEWKALPADVKRGLKTITGTGSWAYEDRRSP